ncbi:MAG: alpha/beta hydrolase [Planctomycetales bacterium]|nr:alpha/beta hydrolase [Planctomycetales bacterium]
MPTLNASGVTLSFQTTGRGPDVVLLHGLAANQAFWLPTALRLAERFRVTTFDLRGHGYSGMPTTGYTPWHMARDVVELMDRLGIQQSHLVGHSFGGVVALGVALKHAPRVRSLTIADSRLRTLQPWQPLREIPEWSRLAAAIRGAGVPIDADEPEIGVSLLEAFATRRWRERFRRFVREDGFVPFAGKWGGGRSADRWLRLMRTTAARRELRTPLFSSPDVLGELKLPVLACYASRSPNLDTFHALSDRLDNCQSQIVPNAGHYFPLTNVEFLLEHWPRFVDSLPLRDDVPPALKCSAEDAATCDPTSLEQAEALAERFVSAS